MNRLNAKYKNEVVPSLIEKFNYKSVMEVPKVEKIVINMGVGDATSNAITLRGERMYDFLDKLVTVSLPRVRDFRGISKKSFDGRGNYTLGVKEQLIFPEIDYDRVDKVRGMDIVIVTTANTDEEAKELLTQLGMPFQK